MPKLSMWRPEKGNDYRWIDRQIRAMYDAGGTGIALYKYLGPVTPTESEDATKPAYSSQSVTNIQDILFLENRDRKYDTDVYMMRGVYQRSDNDFDLTQFGLFLQTGTVIMTFHFNEMIEILGRKIMNGDVLELQHLQDEHVTGIEAALKRYYVVGDCSWASEGFSPLWYPHLWRCKLTPLVDSQEYKGILNQIAGANTSGPKATNTGASTLGDIMSTYQKYLNVNEKIVEQAENELPASGYDVSHIYSFGSDANGNIAKTTLTADNQRDTADNADIGSDDATFSPVTEQNPTGWLTGDGLAPNGLPVTAGISFPANPNQGDYHLRVDYLPNRMFRYSGSKWIKVEDSVRTNLTPGGANNKTVRNSFANNDNTITIQHEQVDPTTGNVTVVNHTIQERQGLSKALRPKADY